MRIMLIAALSLAGLGLAACSEQTQDAAERTAESAADDMGNAAVAASDAVGDAAADVGQAADRAAAATDEMGNKVDHEAAEVEADLHNESVTEAQRD